MAGPLGLYTRSGLKSSSANTVGILGINLEVRGDEMKYLGLGAVGLIVYSAWLLPNGRIVHIDLDRPDYFEHISSLRKRYGEVK